MSSMIVASSVIPTEPVASLSACSIFLSKSFIVLFSFVREQVHKLATNLTFEFAILRALFLTRVLLLMKRFCTILLAMMVGVQSLAAVASEEGWSLEAELGAVLTTGNTDQQNLKFRLGGTLDGEVLKHSAQLDGLRSSENSIVTAQKYYTFYQGDYKLQGDHSLFGRISYEDDRFSGFDYQADLTVGYSRLLMDSGDMTLRGDIGLGSRRSELANGTSQTEFITRLAAKYDWEISENAKFRQLVSAEIGSDSTVTRSETSLQSNIADQLAMKLALTVKNQSEVPVGRKKTDTETSVTLVYTF
jgi:putative salt-induced outer membrane protein